jgi:hypothetical protein
MDKFELEKVMYENGDTAKIMADVLGISLTSFYNRKNERNGSEFTRKDISIMAKRWNLSAERIKKIFFA